MCCNGLVLDLKQTDICPSVGYYVMSTERSYYDINYELYVIYLWSSCDKMMSVTQQILLVIEMLVYSN